MFEDNVTISATLRNFECDIDYLTFGGEFDGFAIQKITKEVRESLRKSVRNFTNAPWDNFLVNKDYYIGRGKSQSVLRDNVHWHFFPLFRAMKLFRTGDLFMPILFYDWKGEWRSTRLHGENYGFGYGVDPKPYVFNKGDIEQFSKFLQELRPYLEKGDFGLIPYQRPPDSLKHHDFRHNFALHTLLKQSMETSDSLFMFDRLIDFTIALESLYLLKSDREKGVPLSSRVAILLGKDASEESALANVVKRFYKIRNDIIHASFVDDKENKFLCDHIHDYEDILRRSILAFLDLNKRSATKEQVIRILEDAKKQPSLRKDIQDKSKLLQMTI